MISSQYLAALSKLAGQAGLPTSPQGNPTAFLGANRGVPQPPPPQNHVAVNGGNFNGMNIDTPMGGGFAGPRPITSNGQTRTPTMPPPMPQRPPVGGGYVPPRPGGGSVYNPYGAGRGLTAPTPEQRRRVEQQMGTHFPMRMNNRPYNGTIKW